MLKVGDKAPEFALHDTELKIRKESEFLAEGEKTIFAFFPGAFTGGCTTEMCTFRDMYQDLQKLNAKVVGISVDSPFSNKGFAEKHGITFPLLSDYKRETIKDYGVTWEGLAGLAGYESANRAVFVVDGSGKIAYEWVGENPGSLPDFDAIKKEL